MTDLESLLNERLAAAFAAVAGEPADPVVRRSQHADFQADGALPLARRLGRAPRDIAADALGRADLADLVATAEISGPGFINLKLRDDALAGLVGAMSGDARLGVPAAAAPETVVIDYSAPNVAKEMHVGHLRSTVIGDAAARTLDWLGHDVRRANHVGDWGTPFGMLIEHLLDLGETEAAHELSVGDLNGFYRAARVKFDADPAFAERSRLRVVALQSGDATTLRLWRLLVDESEKYFLAVYDKLGVTLTAEHFYGESYYNDMLAPVVDALDTLGLLRESDGAQCVFPQGFTGRDGEPQPIIVRKRDGGYGYGATDLAAIRHRTQDLEATRLLYVVGSPQHQHLEMVYQAAREAGWLTEPARAVHVGFGQVLGADGKKLASRAGDTVKLVDLLDEAVARAAAIVAEKNPELDAATRAEVARMVGIGAIKYVDLSSDRIKDYSFHWDRMLSFSGDTGAYLQYTYARINSIFRRGGVAADRAATVLLDAPAERALAMELLGFPTVVADAAQTLQFHRLAGYLQSLAGAYTAFYDNCPVLKAEDAVRASRLLLCDLTARVIAQGLDLLGIEAPERM
ncbi:arginine--tRNA ligase [Catellatospora citrea]|uniref:Arginine--tRNA ligase n=1 Tax=Catellatospora citrea TaxID=53366 RepID=A0A8J3P1Q4_9ACTN|nr:arginine--tRNA ligase [Catellatospora citrea]RKE11946.1 arginyl-tRNA synthetase [Catellatospora citrea]GIG00377.1 arginine--tRNA ligase [Catellatospora citrea]